MTKTDALSADVVSALRIQRARKPDSLVSLIELNAVDERTISIVYVHQGLGDNLLGFVITTARLPGWDEGTSTISASDFADGILDFLDEPPSGAFFRTQPNPAGIRWLQLSGSPNPNTYPWDQIEG